MKPSTKQTPAPKRFGFLPVGALQIGELYIEETNDGPTLFRMGDGARVAECYFLKDAEDIKRAVNHFRDLHALRSLLKAWFMEYRRAFKEHQEVGGSEMLPSAALIEDTRALLEQTSTALLPAKESQS